MLPSLVRFGLVCGLYSMLAAITTWPLLRDGATKLAGDALDPWQTLWGFWWMRHYSEFGSGPMHSRLLWWPDGASLWLQTWDLPSAIATLPLWGRVPEVAVYNCAVFMSFPLSGVCLYLLCREIWGGVQAPVQAGSLYTFSTFHFASATANLHIASMQWSALYVFGLWRTISRPGLGGPLIAGSALAMATLASPYHFVFCATTTAVLFLSFGRGRVIAEWRSVFHRLLIAGGVFATLAGWQLAGMVSSYMADGYSGAHAPVRFSADIESFVIPNAVSRWAALFPASAAWTTSEWASAAYLGYVALGLALYGYRSSPAARPFGLIALVGAILSLGPFLQVGGVTYRQVSLPYGWIEALFPIVRFSGLPSRFAWLTVFGLAVCAGAAMSALGNRGARWRLVTLALTALALVETWPKPFPMTVWPRLSVLEAAATDKGQWAVFDTTSRGQALWNQMLHRHPMVAGYLTRTPDRNWSELRDDYALRPLMGPPYWLGAASGLRLPTTAVIGRLQELNIRLVVVEASRAPIMAPLRFRLVRSEHGVTVYEVPLKSVGAVARPADADR